MSLRSITLPIDGIETEILTGGAGPTLLYLHAGDGVEHARDLLEHLAENFTVWAPSHPGFGGSALPQRLSTVDDLSFFYLDLIQELELNKITLVGSSFGGWIAAEVAIRCCASIDRLVLVGALGVKFSGRETRDIVDIFSIPDKELPGLLCTSDQPQPTYSSMTDERLTRIARNRESLSLFGWSPTLHNPKLRQRLHRINVPTHVIWGERDQIASVSYGRQLASEIPDAAFSTLPDAGHYLHIDQPEQLSRSVQALAAA